MGSSQEDADQAAPVVWLLCGQKAGDNNQILALAETLGWPFIQKQMNYRPWELLSNQLLRVTLAGLDRTRSSRLEPPWPDLVITAGRRNEPVARWIRKHSGDHTRLVHIGRPWASPELFDLVVTTPQYQLPKNDNVVVIDLPLHRINPELLEQAAQARAPEFEQLSHPRWVVLLGGDSGAYRFDTRKARRLARWLNREVTNGSVLVSNSARTPEKTFDAFLDALQVPASVYRWNSGEDNPYLAWLALADRLVITAESISMLSEAVATGKPVYLFSLDDRDYPPSTNLERVRQIVGQLTFKPLSHRLGQRLAPARLRRDITRIHARLLAEKRIAWAGQADTGLMPRQVEPEVEQVARRVRKLFG